MSSPAVAMALALAETRDRVRARPDSGRRARQRDRVPRGIGGARPVPPARVSPHRAVLALRHRLSAPAGCSVSTSAGDDLGRRHRRQPGRRAAGMLGGRHAVQVPALGVRRAERHSRRDARAGRRHGPAARPRRPVRPVRVAPAGRVGGAGLRAQSSDGLGTRWDSRNASFKPFPAAHVLHPYIDLVLRLRAQHGIRPDDVESIECPVAEFNVSIVCEPVAEKVAPATEAHGRVCLQFTLAEALVRGELGRVGLLRRRPHAIPRSWRWPGASPTTWTRRSRRRASSRGRCAITLNDGRVLRRGGGVQPRLGRRTR